MTDRERFQRVMSYQPVDRCVYSAWTNAWPETVERWKAEGYDPSREPIFPADRWIFQGQWFFPNPPFERTVIEEDANTVLYVMDVAKVRRQFGRNLRM